MLGFLKGVALGLMALICLFIGFTISFPDKTTVAALPQPDIQETAATLPPQPTEAAPLIVEAPSEDLLEEPAEEVVELQPEPAVEEPVVAVEEEAVVPVVLDDAPQSLSATSEEAESAAPEVVVSEINERSLPGTPVQPFTPSERFETVGAQQEEDVVPEPEPVAEVASDRVPALIAHAEDVSDIAPEGPVFAIVLIDDPTRPLEETLLARLPQPIAFAIDPGRQDARETAQFYRDLGFEVLLTTDSLPLGAAAQDVAIAFEASRTIVPMSVAVLDTLEGGVKQDPASLGMVLAGIAQSGHGFLTFPGGLGGEIASARRDGVPALSVHRMLDAQAEAAPIITRNLARATFEANRSGQQIVVGNSYPATLQALTEWQSSTSADSITLVPVSTVLRTFGLPGSE